MQHGVSFALVFAFLLSVCWAELVRFDGQQVLRVTVENQNDLQRLQSVLPETVDIWSHDSHLVIGENDIRADADLLRVINATLPGKVDIWIPDLQLHLDNHEIRSLSAAADWNTAYHRYSEMVTRMKEFVSTYPSVARFVPSIGLQSIEKRDIPALILGAADSPTVKRVFWGAGQHAREWIAPAVLFYITEQLLLEYSKGDAVATELLTKLQFVIIPMINPDGYEYTHTSNRLWRKNRRPHSGGVYGTDLNRNWDIKWGQGGSSNNPSSDTYMGTAAFSEPETKAVADYILSKPNFISAIDFHAYSQLILRAYGWSNNLSPHETLLKGYGANMAAQIKANGGKTYTNQRAVELYLTTGSADDWAYSKGIIATFCIELRDTGSYGFQLPASQIIPNGVEIWAAVKPFTKDVLANNS